MVIVDAKSINPLELPSLALSNAFRRYLPTSPAVYFVIQDNSEVIYIGQTQNLKHRWNSHHKIVEIKQISGDIRIGWYVVDDKHYLQSLEKSLIDLFKPKLNVGSQFKKHIVPLAKHPINMKLPPFLDDYVRSLPNKSEWLREAIAEKIAKERNSLA